MKQEPKLDPRAVKLLNGVMAILRKLPKAYDQNYPGAVTKKPTCKSPVCIVGWMLYIRVRYWSNAKKLQLRRDDVIAVNAAPYLFLTEDQLLRLYWPDSWPEDLRVHKDYRDYTAKEGIARIKRFIRTDGEE